MQFNLVSLILVRIPDTFQEHSWEAHFRSTSKLLNVTLCVIINIIVKLMMFEVDDDDV